MSFKQFQPGCPCCCFDPLIIICIYDESTPYSYFTPRPEYTGDLTAWDNFIDGLQVSTIRLGLLQPGYTEDQIRDTTQDWPYDTDNNPINYINVGMQTPRVLEANIVNFFETLRTTPTTINPQLLLFCLDNSGSIVVSQYQTELNNAKASLQSTYPSLRILNDISNAGERWLRDALTGATGRTCG